MLRGFLTIIEVAIVGFSLPFIGLFLLYLLGKYVA
jgi:hypothetical protein